MANNKAFKVKNGLELGAISDTITDTAVDVFVYDTAKDSDGGAWRHRTQATSWYNETLNTATRGSRKEFPAVAVIVAESNQVTIYDGDDPDLPMWMVFNASNNAMIKSSSISSISIANGEMYVGMVGNADLQYISFIRDTARWITASTAYGGFYKQGGIDKRNDTSAFGYYNNVAGISDITIVNSTINDVAMTVLPNAPIDAATGLPVPTIAVATDGGVSVIKDDGNVYDLAPTNSPAAHIIDFHDAYIYVSTDIGSYDANTIYKFSIPSSDQTNSFYSQMPSYIAEFNNLRAGTHVGNQGNGLVNGSAYGSSLYGLGLLFEDTTTPANSSMAYTTSTYNTGWMNGDIKLATLSDTDATNVTGSELVTNGDFATNSDWSYTGAGTGWSISGGTLNYDGTGGQYQKAYQNITVQSGNVYVLEVELTALSGGDVSFAFATPDIGSTLTAKTISSTGKHNITWTATRDTISVYMQINTATQTFSFDNVTLRLAEEDRSVNDNGLQVFGTVTKSAVATGADLVAYSGFDNGGTSYLEQPYNSGLDFSGDFCFIAWVYGGDADSAYPFSYGGPNGGGSDKLIFLRTLSSSYQFGTYDATDGTNTITGPSVSNNWHCLCGLRRGGTVEFYHNGVLQGSYTRDYDFTGTSTHKVRVGLPPWNTGPFNVGSVALARISETAPSPEQILKMYNDEKFLFQENAQATLYGSSDAVTALAYDDTTELLHAGTSAGRSVFQGLRRVDNTTTAVSAAISASNNLVGEQ